MMANSAAVKSVFRNIGALPKHLEYLRGQGEIKNLFDIQSPIGTVRSSLYRTLYEGIGSTGCYSVGLPNGNLLRVKMEYSNSMGNTHYSRYYLPYLFLAESLGIIVPGETKLLEVTSGSAGIALTMATKVLGYDTTIIVPEMLPSPRIQPMIDNGGNVIRVEGYIDKCIEKLRSMLAMDNYFAINHSEEKADIIVHVFSRIAYEYYRDFGGPDYAIIGMGNGTTTLAIFQYMKSVSPDTRRMTYHPRLDAGEYVFGLYGPDVELRHVKMAGDLAHETKYTTGMSFEETLKLFADDTEISNLGPSSLYGIQMALELSRQVSGKTIWTIGYDKNDRYLPFGGSA